MGSPQLPFPLLSRHSPSVTRQGCLLLSPIVCPPSSFLGGSPVQSRVCPEQGVAREARLHLMEGGTRYCCAPWSFHLLYKSFSSNHESQGTVRFHRNGLSCDSCLFYKDQEIHKSSKLPSSTQWTTFLASVSCVRPHENTCSVRGKMGRPVSRALPAQCPASGQLCAALPSLRHRTHLRPLFAVTLR